MIPRVLEPEVMDTEQEAVDYDAMDHSTVNRVFVEDFLGHWNGDGTVLDLGTGTAQIPIELCRVHETCSVVAVDLAAEMLKVAKQNTIRAGLADRITLQHLDAKTLPFGENHFPAVISNSIIHHIPNPQHVIREMARVVQPGGFVFVRDLLRPNDEAELDRFVQTYAKDANAHQQKMFADSLRAALTIAELEEMMSDLRAQKSRVAQTTDRHWTWVMHK